MHIVGSGTRTVLYRSGQATARSMLAWTAQRSERQLKSKIELQSREMEWERENICFSSAAAVVVIVLDHISM
jgi:hypothetical protein